MGDTVLLVVFEGYDSNSLRNILSLYHSLEYTQVRLSCWNARTGSTCGSCVGTEKGDGREEISTHSTWLRTADSCLLYSEQEGNVTNRNEFV